MREGFQALIFVIICLSTYVNASSQENIDTTRSYITIIDSLKKSGAILNSDQTKADIVFTKSESVKFLKKILNPHRWYDPNNPLRQAIGQLVFEASNPPFDSTEYILNNYPYDSLNIPREHFYKWEPLTIKNPDDENKDTTVMVIVDTLKRANSSYSGFPFKHLSFPNEGDSIQAAVKPLIEYLKDRDSTVIRFTGLYNITTPVWLNTKSNYITPYWLKNDFSDSVTVWIGSPSRNTFGLYLEQGVSFKRLNLERHLSNAKIKFKELDNSTLIDQQNITIKTQYWKSRTEASFIFSQGSVSNWVKGGENSISTLLDITGYADYQNKLRKISSNNFVRLKFGYIASGDYGIRKSIDLLETNSNLNHKAFGNFDFSTILLFKTQIAPGYNYPNDSVMVSKFLNPATLVIGFGLDYKLNKLTSINFSPLSYKGTFVTDTSKIDQTKYGIPKNRKSLNEPGISFTISNEYKPVKDVTIINRLQLFTNYIHNPQNIDVDWEMIAVASLNWFTDVRFNTHLIFDDDARTVELDKNKKPVVQSDGTQKKTARIQFKEMLGFSLAFRF